MLALNYHKRKHCSSGEWSATRKGSPYVSAINCHVTHNPSPECRRMGGPSSTFCRLKDVAAKQAGGAKRFPALHPAHVSDLVLSVVPPCSCGFRIDRTISAPSRHASPHLRRARQRQ